MLRNEGTLDKKERREEKVRVGVEEEVLELEEGVEEEVVDLRVGVLQQVVRDLEEALAEATSSEVRKLLRN